MISSPHNEETNDAPSIGDGDYGVVCAVFLATAIILGGSTVFVARFCFPDNTKEPSIKQTVTHRLSSVAWCLYTLVSFASFVQDDGASVTFIDYLCDKNELFGLIDWRKKTAAVEEVKHAGAAAVHPHGLDASITKTDDVKGDMGKPVTIEEVKLQPPTQHQ
ncbi:hypothetical protein PC114_g6193 [Phytophthora cactorum]|nr:hypothetical protein PC114_g6193 [Phytophthora cactorum]KAG4060785.1 hypothetical protein PC123_g4356 [Phytophthora cactorum]